MDGLSGRRDDEILYDFLSANPDTLQPRLLITRQVDSEEFAEAFGALGLRWHGAFRPRWRARAERWRSSFGRLTTA